MQTRAQPYAAARSPPAFVLYGLPGNQLPRRPVKRSVLQRDREAVRPRRYDRMRERQLLPRMIRSPLSRWPPSSFGQKESSIRLPLSPSDSLTCRPQNTFYAFIDRMAALQITLGCTPDHMQYCPSDPVKREQMAAFIIRGLGEFNPRRPGVSDSWMFRHQTRSITSSTGWRC